MPYAQQLVEQEEIGRMKARRTIDDIAKRGKTDDRPYIPTAEAQWTPLLCFPAQSFSSCWLPPSHPNRPAGRRAGPEAKQ